MANIEPCQCFGTRTTIKAAQIARKTSVSIADSTVNKLKDDYYYLSSRFYAAIEIAFCYALFSVNPFSGWISKRALVESLSLETIIPSVSHGIKLFVENILTDKLFK